MSTEVTQLAADLSKLKADLEAKALAEEHKVSTWFKTNWLHLVNAGGIGATILKLFGKL